MNCLGKATRLFLLALLASLIPPVRAQDVTLPAKADSVRFAVIGDIGTGDRAQYEVAQRMVDSRRKFPFDFVIMVGDNIYGSESASALRKKFEIPYKPLLEGGVKFYAALGNHDDTNQRFYEFFNMNGKQYYTFKKGNVRFFALNSNYMDPQQLAWLEQELKASGSDWKVCYFHHPLYSSGRAHGSSTELRLLLEPIFVKYGVQVVFQGHDHSYERVKPQKGIYYFTEGASGKLKTNNLAKTDLTATGFDRAQTFMLVEVVADELHFQTFSRTGATVDSGVIRRPAQAQSATRVRKPRAQPAAASSGRRSSPRSPGAGINPRTGTRSISAPAPPRPAPRPIAFSLPRERFEEWLVLADDPKTWFGEATWSTAGNARGIGDGGRMAEFYS